jgi:hypothetical protein
MKVSRFCYWRCFSERKGLAGFVPASLPDVMSNESIGLGPKLIGGNQRTCSEHLRTAPLRTLPNMHSFVPFTAQAQLNFWRWRISKSE